MKELKKAVRSLNKMEAGSVLWLPTLQERFNPLIIEQKNKPKVQALIEGNFLLRTHSNAKTIQVLTSGAILHSFGWSRIIR